ncbi:MAG TPA: hypothetical protein VES40_03470, partial [Ilumatobacteraceae bacterium]|nr:hypothetical protein [Ilumatobacteraceae bacterium]
GECARIETGQTVPLDTLRAGPIARADSRAPGSDLGLTPGQSGAGKQEGALADAGKQQGAIGETAPTIDSLAAATTVHEASFETALADRDADRAVAAILELESAIVDWSRDTLQSDDVDRARAALRSMIVRLGAAATEGVRDVREVLGPVVEAALAARVVARSEKAFAVSDAIRDELAKAGIEVRDTPDGVEWLVVE